MCGTLSFAAAGPDTSPPALRVGEDRLGYAQRYDEWLRTVPTEDQAWSILDGVYAKLTDAGPDEHPQLVEQLHGVLSHPVLGMPTRELGVDDDDDSDEDKLLIGLLLPHIPMLRAQSEMLLVDTQRAAEQNEHERIITNLRTLGHLGRIGSIADLLIEGVQMINTDQMMSDLVLDGTLELRSWNTQALESVAAIYNAPLAWEPAGRFLEAERAIYANFLDWIYFDAVDGHLTLKGAERLLRLAPDRERGELVARTVQNSVDPREDQEEVIASIIESGLHDLSHPIADKPELISRRMRESKSMLSPAYHGLRFMPAAVVMPALDRFAEIVLEARVKRDAAILYIAAHRHRARHGSFPQSVEDIDQNLLPHTPTDPYTDDALKLKIHEDQLVIYSLGPDRDDDHGRGLAEHRFILSYEFSQFDTAQREQWDGDWVLTEGG